MMRTLVIGDIHGGLHGLHQVLERAEVTTNDQLIFLGDYVDGWSQSPEVIDLLIELDQKQQCTFIKGNHDQLFLDWLLGRKENFDETVWYKHGGEATVTAYENIGTAKREKHIAFLKSLKNYYLDDQYRLFIHAGFTNMNGVDFEYFDKLFYWDRTLWETAVALDTNLQTTDSCYPKRFTLYPEIYIGHTPVTKVGSTIPLQKACVWNIDTGAGFKGALTIMDIDTKNYWQSEPLPNLYPIEKGRND